ncbi:hypothetical protein F4556_001681 [Kitasatospora gansuensis]|uniref:Uncharacterized protein n=1 Tax=Kitasatospora gansuensis TaxID=258050 RepID=A0A7W7S919_9ACTN|nr:hypothetical protein [Kitasatospora gansuensis]MBB4946146.1 hypothetical protein [Kitasatospora gansuensis]
MTSFVTHRERVLDPSLSVLRRHRELWVCLEVFAPYGFHGTYHHLTVSARMPRDLASDPDSLVRAVTELDRARVLWQAAGARYAERRRVEKRELGLRAPRRPGPWWQAEPAQGCYVVDVLCHPGLCLPEYVHRQVLLAEGAELPGCRECGDERPVVSRSTGHGFIELCPGCAAVRRSCACGVRHVLRAGAAVGWPSLRLREHLTADGLPRETDGIAERIAQLELVPPPRVSSRGSRFLPGRRPGPSG